MCTSDADCPGSQVCYANTTWWINANKNAPGTYPPCMCSTWYGISNFPNCTEHNTTTASWWIATGITFSLCFGLLTVASFLDLVRLFRANALRRDAASTSMVQLFLGCLCVTVSQGLAAAIPIRTYLLDQINPVDLQKQSTLQSPSNSIGILGAVSILASILSVPIFWIETVSAHAGVRRNLSKRATIFIASVELIFSFGAFVCIGLDNLYTPFVVFAVSLPVLVIYIIGLLLLARLSKIVLDSTSITSYRILLRKMQLTAVAVVVVMLFTLANVIVEITYVLYTWQEVLGPPNPEQVPRMLVVVQLASWFPLLGGGLILYSYLHAALQRRIAPRIVQVEELNNDVNNDAHHLNAKNRMSGSISTLYGLAIEARLKASGLANDPDIVDDGSGGAATVLTTHVVDLGDTDGILWNSSPEFLKQFTLAWSSFFSQRPVIKYIVAMLATTLCTATTWIALTFETNETPVAWVFTSISFFVNIPFLALSVSRPVALRLLKTPFLQVRAIFSLANAVLMIIAFANDGNLVAFVFGLLVAWITAFLSDAFCVEGFRNFVVALALGPTLATAVAMTIGGVPSFNNVVLPIGSGFSIGQSARDFLFTQSALLLAEFLFLLRGRGSRRFKHLGEPIQRVVLGFNEDDTSTTNKKKSTRKRGDRSKFFGNASSIHIQSGFLVKDVSTAFQSQFEQHGKARVYINTLALRKADSIWVVAFGLNRGRHVFEWFDSSFARLLYTVSYVPPPVLAAITCSRNDVSPWYGVLVLPSLIFIAARNAGGSSKLAMGLLVRRFDTLVSVAFLCLWLGLVISVFQDARLLIAIFALLAKIQELFSDAVLLARPTLKIRVLLEIFKSTPTFVVFAVVFMLGDVHNGYDDPFDAAQVVGGEKNASVLVSPNAVSTFDPMQLAADASFAWAFHGALRAIWVWTLMNWGPNQDWLETVSAPLAPNRKKHVVNDNRNSIVPLPETPDDARIVASLFPENQEEEVHS